MPGKPRGIVLGVVVLSALVLGVFIFSYHRMVVQQNIRAHHEQIGEIAARLSLTGANILAEHVNAGGDSLIYSVAPQLLDSVPPSSKKVAGISVTAIKDDFQLYLNQLQGSLGEVPNCSSMEIAFEKIEQISPGTTTSPNGGDMQRGRDPFEKTGEVVISCTVEYRKLSRRAKIMRQFKVVSMVPGPYARFSLFVPFTPFFDSYNDLGVKHNGSIDTTYKHKMSGIPQSPLDGPLKIFNGTGTYLSGTSPDAKADLKNRGWIFLGPSHGNPSVNESVLLKIPSGYSSVAGGHFLFAKPPLTITKPAPTPPQLSVPHEEISDPANFNLNGPPFQCKIGGIYQGFFTYADDPTWSSAKNELGAGAYELWENVTTGSGDRYKCASSWLFPFGDMDNPSRTLIIGEVLAGFLKFYYLKDIKPPGPPQYSREIKPKKPVGASPPNVYAPGANILVSSPKYSEVFLQPSALPDQGYNSFSKVSPRNYVPGAFTAPPTGGTAFNVFFDCMDYPGDVPTPPAWNYPPFGGGSHIPIISSHSSSPDIRNPIYVPRWDAMNLAGGISGLHPMQDIVIRFKPTDGAKPGDNHYFEGNLEKFEIPSPISHPLSSRVTHYIDLSKCANQNEEKTRLENLMFTRRTNPPSSGIPAGTWYTPRQTGIYYVNRSATNAAGNPLSLPSKIYLEKDSMILILGDGDLLIPDTIRSPLVDGAPENLFSIIVVNGNIKLGTPNEVDAYLVALKKGNGSPGSGGKLMSDGSNRKINIFGGLAIREMGLYPGANVPTTMGEFPGGGTIRYNPRFNPSIETLYPKSRKFIMEDKASKIEITGGG